jgi:tetratricopeptide (TPR) repeat protein
MASLLVAVTLSAAAQETVQTYAAPTMSVLGSAEGSVTLVAGPFDWLGQAKALERQGDWHGLLDWGLRWSREEPDNPLAWYVLGRANNALQRPGEAVAAYRQALRLDPADVLAYNNLGNAYRNDRRYPEALAAYREALRLKPDCARAWQGLALTYYAFKGVAGVSQALQELRKADPQLADAWQKLALEFSRSQDARLAGEALQVLASLDAAQRERLFGILFADR